jgi:hypothetical protein
MFIKSKYNDGVWNKLENWEMSENCEIIGIGPMGLEVYGMIKAVAPFEKLEAGQKIGIMDYGWWILGEPKSLSKQQLHTIYTAHYRYPGSDRVDITVKGQDPNWKEFAPTWKMVMGVKNGTMSEQEYVDLYAPTGRQITVIGSVSEATWERLYQMETATFVCFCPEGAFCHRNILLNYILEIMGGKVVYGGWRK